jgi:hypothetical protein
VAALTGLGVHAPLVSEQHHHQFEQHRITSCSSIMSKMASSANRTMLAWILQLTFPVALLFLFSIYSQRQHAESKSLWAQLHHTLADMGKQFHGQGAELSVSIACTA